MAKAADHLTQIVRTGDPERYLSVLYAPEDRRPALLALYAFNIEVARVRDAVREPLPGEIRLQWWRDAIAAPEGAMTGNPVADALRAAIAAHDLPIAAFDNMLEARIFDLYDDPMPDRTTLEGYCGETAGALIQFAALILDREAAMAHAALAGHAGCAQAIAGALRLLPIHRSRGQCYVPADILAAAGVDRETFIAGGEGSERAVAAMAALGREHVVAFERGAKRLPASLRPAFLPAAFAGAHLERLEAAPRGGGRPLPALRRHWIAFRRATRGW
ncbi:phytoene/squalene synthase family protein [Aquibium carbonis]|uniref:Phytoene/squalene synthase family protein n=1 Tax=Aquibium carbonis TaxID=2495581 RepID=A0A429YYX4_9HYPH|nr:phytoene/squalene synthase family protein [Aquibium carbonis]RST86508.1 phytoene/squalene synthase family protein [Aquibium carbonis]